MLEFFVSEQTKRLFGFIAAGGSAGALLGPLVSRRSRPDRQINVLLF